MKIRRGFVSNSSSSSFICDLTGHVESGMDYSLTDCVMVECVHGHTFEYVGYPDVEAWVDSSGDEDEDENEYAKTECGGYVRNVECNYNMPASLCPICNGDKKTKKIIIKRIKTEMERLNISANDIK